MANARQDDRLLFLSVSGSRHPFPVLPLTAFHPLRMRVHQWLDSHAALSSRLAHILRQHIPHHPPPQRQLENMRHHHLGNHPRDQNITKSRTRSGVLYLA